MQTITIRTDSEQPDIMCPADITIGCNDPVPAVNLANVSATDDCTPLQDVVLDHVQDIIGGTGCTQVIRRIYRATDKCGNKSRCVQLITRQSQVTMTGKVFLSGPYAAGIMPATLNGLNLIPLTQPYSAAPYNYAGTESVGSIPAGVVDWVLVRLRNPMTMAVITTRAAFVKSNGDIVGLDGVSPVAFSTANGMYAVTVHHRNHLDVRATGTIDFTSGTANVNLTTQSSGQLLVAPGVYALVKGDVNQDGIVNNTDLVTLAPNASIGFSNVYNLFDINMDALVNSTDLIQLAPIASVGYAQNF
jgi:hypothetical protein